MIVKHPRMIIYQHQYFINYRYVGDVSVTEGGTTPLGVPRLLGAPWWVVPTSGFDMKISIFNINNQPCLSKDQH